jgi:hypothetical protein
MWLETIIKYSLITMTILILGTGYIKSATAQSSKYDSVSVCKGLQMLKDEIKNNPEQFLKEALGSIQIAQHKHQCKI